ncbi:unnamed protein product [Prorocentrum cordatum]|uniref:Uncharacterized protein n=1 Tax=Prorocentrum cordatum TaxID=2364126 RepID=A0ABN9SYQ6_9DINO|nr:unnamed protein product [Polarella glacialis]
MARRAEERSSRDVAVQHDGDAEQAHDDEDACAKSSSQRRARERLAPKVHAQLAAGGPGRASNSFANPCEQLVTWSCEQKPRESIHAFHSTCMFVHRDLGVGGRGSRQRKGESHC